MDTKPANITDKIIIEQSEVEITPLVISLSGVIVLEDDFDNKTQCTDYLMEKYK